MLLELVHAIVEPMRMKIIKSLLYGPKYISQIADAIKTDRSVVSYHLGVLEKYGLLTSEYKVLVEPRSRGKAARVYKINSELLRKALAEAEKILPELKPPED